MPKQNQYFIPKENMAKVEEVRYMDYAEVLTNWGKSIALI
jgi:hypothetical protein